MTSRQRIEAALRHREPDRTPMFEYLLLSPLADIFLGRPYILGENRWELGVRELGWEAAVRQCAIDRLDLAQRLGHDMLCVSPTPLPPHPGPGLPSESTPATDPVECLRRRNEVAAAQPPLSDETFLVYAFLREEMRRRDLDLPVLAPAYGHGVWTDVDLMQTMLLAPEIAHQHFALATRSSLDRIDRYLSLEVDFMGIGGDFAGTRPMISPAMYRDFMVPEVRLLSRHIHAAGAWAVNASDGDLWSMIDDFLVDCEVDAYLEIDLHAGMDLSRLKAAYGDRITLFGNLDCGNILSFNTPAQVRQHVLDCLEAGWGDGGHILCASNAITASVPLENYLALMGAYRERFGLPPFRLETQ